MSQPSLHMTSNGVVLILVRRRGKTSLRRHVPAGNAYLQGSTTSREVSHILKVFQKTKLYAKLQKYLDTEEGSALLESFEKITREHCGDIVSELQGVADGGCVDYRELFLLNLEPEWLALFSEVPESSHGLTYASTVDGCTNIHLPIPGSKQMYLGHTEDIDPEIKDSGYLVHHEIHNCNDREPTECFTEYILPGILGGSKFGFNKEGFMYAHNNIYQQGLNKSGIPRRFILRSLVSVKNMKEAIHKIKKFPGIATGYTFNCIYIEDINGQEKVINGIFEVAGNEKSGSQIIENYPKGTYCHYNTFQHLRHPCHPEESSIRRAAILKQIISHDQLCTHSDLLKALSNQEDKEYPVFRTGVSPDYLSTAISGVFDSSSMMLTVYADRPDIAEGQKIDVLRYKSK